MHEQRNASLVEQPGVVLVVGREGRQRKGSPEVAVDHRFRMRPEVGRLVPEVDLEEGAPQVRVGVRRRCPQQQRGQSCTKDLRRGRRITHGTGLRAARRPSAQRSVGAPPPPRAAFAPPGFAAAAPPGAAETQPRNHRCRSGRSARRRTCCATIGQQSAIGGAATLEKAAARKE